ncbi:MAG: zeta toxin family protein [bacterium]
MAGERPLVVVLVGPNGAGKSTSAGLILRDALAVSEFVNADSIAGGLSAFRPETVAVAAGRIMLARVSTLAAAGADFAFETTLSGRSFAPRLAAMKRVGYEVHLAFLSLPSPDLAVARVAERVAMGGHDVPERTVRRRFVAGVRNFFDVYQPLANAWQVWDNSVLGGPRLIASSSVEGAAVVHDPSAWHHLQRLR